MRSGEVWTGWFNTDSPHVGQGDFETVERIKELYQDVCREGYTIMTTQCRDEVSQEVFDESKLDHVKNKLSVGCNTSGLVCLNDQQTLDQTDYRMCNDFSIRFLCRRNGDNSTSSDSLFPQFDVRIYIILAVVPILIFLFRVLWAYVYRRRRLRQRNERRAARLRLGLATSISRDDDDDTASINSALANPPPSYHQLFGTGAPSIFAISRENVPICPKCKADLCCVTLACAERPGNSHTLLDSLNGSTQYAAPEVDSSQHHLSTLDSDGLSKINKAPPSAVISVGGSGTEDGPTVSNPTLAVSSNVCDAQDIESGLSTASGRALSTDGLTVSSNDIDSQGRLPSSHQTFHEHHELGVSTTNTTATSSLEQLVETTNQPSNSGVHPNAFPLSVPIASQHTHTGANGISQPCACACHRTIPSKTRGEVGYENQGYHPDEEQFINGNNHIQGMHTQVPGLQRVWSNLSTSSNLTLSELPCYEDALKIIKKKEEASGK